MVSHPLFIVASLSTLSFFLLLQPSSSFDDPDATMPWRPGTNLGPLWRAIRQLHCRLWHLHCMAVAFAIVPASDRRNSAVDLPASQDPPEAGPGQPPRRPRQKPKTRRSGPQKMCRPPFSENRTSAQPKGRSRNATAGLLRTAVGWRGLGRRRGCRQHPQRHPQPSAPGGPACLCCRPHEVG